MIVDKRHAGLILCGRKTAHVIKRGARLYEPEQSIAVFVWREIRDSYNEVVLDRNGEPKRGQVEITRVKVESIEETMLHELDDLVAIEGGFDDAAELFDWWWDKHREGWGHNNPGAAPIEIPVRVLRFQLDPDSIRIPAKQAGQRHPHQYTGSNVQALNEEEPEAVDELTQRRFSMEAEQGKAATWLERQARWERLSLEERMRAVRAEAAARGLDLSPQFASIERRLESIRQRLRRDAA